MHAIRSADDVSELPACALSFYQRLILDLQRLLLMNDRDLLQRARDFLFQQVVVERLVNKIEGAKQERFVRRLFVGEGRHHDDFHVGLQLAGRAQQINAAHVRHLHV